MSEEIVCNLLGKGELEFAELLEARDSDNTCDDGQGATVHGWRTDPLRNTDRHSRRARDRRDPVPNARRTGTASDDDREADFNHSAGQPYQFSWPCGADLTIARIAPDFLEEGRRARAACEPWRWSDSTALSTRCSGIWAASCARNCAVHRKLDSTYLHSVATVLTR